MTAAAILRCLDSLAGSHRWIQDGTRRAGPRTLPVYVCGWCNARK